MVKRSRGCLPLYESCDVADPYKPFHAGLWFDKFYDCYSQKDWSPGEEKAKAQWFETLTRAGCVGDGKLLEAYRQRMARLRSAVAGISLEMKSQGSFATGLGLPHPVENGFTWHPTLGVPYLCGAAVKGILRAWKEVWDCAENEESSILDLWFGTPDRAGCLVFFDALPIAPPCLEVDIMTPHYGNWYQKGWNAKDGENQKPDTVPADWHDPVPVKFLVVKAAAFLFTIAPRQRKHADQVAPAMAALSDALEWMGAGAKTAVGYGRFTQ